MPIHTRASLTAKFNICEGGTARTAQTLDRLGLTMDSPVTMGLILREMGLSDCVFSFCAVEKKDRAAADKALRSYMLHITGLALRFIVVTHNAEYGEVLLEANKVINKRCEGHSRPAQLARAYAKINDLYRAEADPKIKYWLDVYRCMLSDKPDYLAATHGGIALMDGANVAGIKEPVHAELVDVLYRYLGETP